MWSGFQSISAAFLIACAANFGDPGIDENVGAGGLHADDLRVDGRVGGLIGGGEDDHAGLVAETVLHPFQIVLAEIVVLIEHRYFAVGLVLQM